MKTLHVISALTILIAVTLTTSLNASTPKLKSGETKYFGTSMLANTLSNTNSDVRRIVPEFDFAEEAYINDIPFNTACVTAICSYKKAIAIVFEMEEETYVEDIPFDTKTIAENSMESKSENIDFEEEAYIDDIPFNTFVIAAESDFKNNLTVK